MSVSDNFDYNIPTLKRNQTMYLDTIKKGDAVIRPFKKLYTQRNWSANLYNLDIDCSIPRRFGVFTNKVDFINKNDDIERTNPRILHYPLNKPEYNLTNADIEKSSPQIHHLNTKRCTDPLEPKYTLSKVEDYPPEIPKFLRETNYIKDIAGTHPQKYFQWKTRETFPLDNFGIQGSKSKPKYVRNTVGNMKYHYLDYSDLTRDIFKTSRHISPLDPVYNFKPQNNKEKPYSYGLIEKSKPQTNYPFHYDPAFNLKTDDIDGCAAGTKNKVTKFNGTNYSYNTKDIRGASVGSLKKGIVTTRCTNPLYPKYQYLGEVELNKAKQEEYSEKVRRENARKLSNAMKSEFGGKKNSLGKSAENNLENNVDKNVGDSLINEQTHGQKINENMNKMAQTHSGGFLNRKESYSVRTNKENKIKTPSVKSAFSEPGKELVVSSPPNYEEQKNCEVVKQCQNEGGQQEYKNPYDHGYNTFYSPNIPKNQKSVKKPVPNYGYIHEPCIQSSENLERLDEIEKQKMMERTVYMANKGTNGFVNMENQRKNFDLEVLSSKEKNASKNVANSSGNVSELSKMNKTFGFGFRNKKSTYAQKLDKFMQENRMPYNISNFNNNIGVGLGSFNQPKNLTEQTKAISNQKKSSYKKEKITQ